VGHFRLLIGILVVSASAADAPLDDLLHGIETRYNHAQALQVLFKLDYTPAGRPHRTESGVLMLRKPGRMRWDYSQPKGKLFIGDGKKLWIYTPDDNRAEEIPMKESDDMRAPLAFLLGKLNFRKEFQNFRSASENGATRIMAEPKGESLPYSAVEFLVSADHVIREVKVTGYDKSIMDFTFDQERMDPKLDDKLFRFQPPAGAEVVKGGQ
jgi:outer membrane lipoprotein carrier protein